MRADLAIVREGTQWITSRSVLAISKILSSYRIHKFIPFHELRRSTYHAGSMRDD